MSGSNHWMNLKLLLFATEPLTPQRIILVAQPSWFQHGKPLRLRGTMLRPLAAHEDFLPEWHTLRSQDVVSGDNMEPEIWHAEVCQVHQSREADLAIEQLDFEIILGLEILALRTVERFDRALNAGVEIGEGLLVVLHFRSFVAGDTWKHGFGCVACGLNVERQGLWRTNVLLAR